MSLKEYPGYELSGNPDYIATLKSLFFFHRQKHADYAKQIHDAYATHKGHSYYSMQSFHALQQYNKDFLDECAHLSKQYENMCSLGIVGSVQYGVAIPGISDVDGVLMMKGNFPYTQNVIVSGLDALLRSYGFSDNIRVQQFDVEKGNYYKYFPDLFTLASSPNSPIDAVDDYLYALPEHPYDWNVWLDIINQYDTYMQEKEKQPDLYAQRLINVIGLQHFASAADWQDYRNQLFHSV